VLSKATKRAGDEFTPKVRGQVLENDHLCPPKLGQFLIHLAPVRSRHARIRRVRIAQSAEYARQERLRRGAFGKPNNVRGAGHAAPAMTASFVLLCDDPDAPAGTWHHWAVYDIDAKQDLPRAPATAVAHARVINLETSITRSDAIASVRSRSG
jgi:phosphatidylethanolamine-binding protein (PEBP) family uncharacterized protein